MGSLNLKNLLLTMNLDFPASLSVCKEQVVSQALSFVSCDNFLSSQGNYTPKNDYLFVWQNIPAALSPNFILFFCSGQTNLSISTVSGDLLNAAPINKMLLLPLGASTPNPVNNVLIEGRTTAPTPMVQNQTVAYWAIMGQAVYA